MPRDWCCRRRIVLETLREFPSFYSLPVLTLLWEDWSKSTRLVLLLRLFSAECFDLTCIPSFRELSDIFRISS